MGLGQLRMLDDRLPVGLVYRGKLDESATGKRLIPLDANPPEVKMRDETEREPQVTAPTLFGASREDWAWVTFAIGAVGVLGALLRRNRSPVDWLLPLGILGGGAAMLLREREQGIARAHERIAAELDQLDPLARAQILKRLASAQIEPLRRGEAAESKD